jgi:hypothetical protein
MCNTLSRPEGGAQSARVSLASCRPKNKNLEKKKMEIPSSPLFFFLIKNTETS